MDNYKPAGFWIRFLANFVDGIIISLMALIIAVIIGDQTFFQGGSSEDSISEGISSLLYSVVFIIIFTASKFRGSPGKMVCKIQVLNKDMTQISILKSIGRYFSYILSAIPFMLGFIVAGFTENKKALHDVICGTRVVYRNK
ncbi:RDD family protein [Virgibacillus halodenitrificans]|uniref:RDD family protein n=1 Tax=Virgibacillus halodenitrificans TaxID=1482 RepID=A0ABR7VLB8_VIRHA|nr:RDD family protein [Virgibacillus halodenitrificans]MBD1221627.1 RDD family protein [Virgibacillus halodenitrificans]MCG1029705.1 RDD family protein [Virgibacillus halodenitrificans]MYL47404.1 RDD family protein [Virgibacillus halodenitrificans]MYL58314.1 RDD family protein [Virgibacillus halodenitrificans]WHX24835.1 RDD family protein [Virgibacillus halodenitrificans]